MRLKAPLISARHALSRTHMGLRVCACSLWVSVFVALKNWYGEASLYAITNNLNTTNSSYLNKISSYSPVAWCNISTVFQ